MSTLCTRFPPLRLASAISITSRPASLAFRHSPTVLPRPLPTTSFLKRFFFGGSSASPEEIMAAKQKAQQIIDENSVVVFSKSYCPYCRATKTMLSEAGAKFYAIELDQVDDGSEIQNALAEMTSQRTVPNVFINKQHIGGNSDLQSKKSQLPQLLKEAGAL